MMDFPQQITQSWPRNRWQDHRLVLAVSGGADSVALLAAFSELQPDRTRLHVAHVNYGLRSHESDQDQQFVENLCAKWHIPYTVKATSSEELSNQRPGQGLESAARQFRYEFFRQTASELGARYILTAHTADDQIETVLHNLFRGSSIAGLAGMNRIRLLSEAVTLVRPMLDIRRSEVEAWLKTIQQDFRTDSSNKSDEFTRNRIRNSILPVVESQLGRQALESVLSVARLAQNCRTYLNSQASSVLERAQLERNPRYCRLNRSSLASEDSFLRCEVFVELWKRQEWPRQSLTQDHWEQLSLHCESTNRVSLSLPGRVQCVFSDGQIELKRTTRN